MNEPSTTIRHSNRSHPRRRATLLRDKARVRARRLGLEFDLPIDWVRNQLERGTCAVTGIPFDLAIGLGSRFHGKYAPTIDRIDPNLGYTIQNCQAVICQYNATKGAWTHEDVITLARTLIARERAGKTKNELGDVAKEIREEEVDLTWCRFAMSAEDVALYKHMRGVQEPFMRTWVSAGYPMGAAAFLGPRLVDGSYEIYFSPKASLCCYDLVVACGAQPCDKPAQTSSLTSVLILLAGDGGGCFN